MIRRLAVLLALVAGTAQADNGADLIDALSASCIEPLESGGALAEGLTKAPVSMSMQLLNGKDATLWRLPNAKLLVVAHNSGNTCEVMALGVDMAVLANALRGWAFEAGYTIADGENMDLATGGGAYIVRALDEGFVQIFVHTDAPRGFAGISAGRVEDSAQAREVLGM